MCGRYTLRTKLNLLLSQFAAETALAYETEAWQPRYNIAPTQEVPAVRLNEAGKRELVALRWGLIPSWAKDAKIAYSTINARADTVATKPAFRSAYKKRRCLVPADGYYEWLKEGRPSCRIFTRWTAASRSRLPGYGNRGSIPPRPIIRRASPVRSSRPTPTI